MTLDFNINGKPKNQRKPTKKKPFQVRDNAFLIYSNSLQEVNTKRFKKNSHCGMYNSLHHIKKSNLIIKMAN